MAFLKLKDEQGEQVTISLFEIPEIVPAEIKEKWSDSNWRGFHSADYYKYGHTRDDAYLRKEILPLLPCQNLDEIKIQDLWDGWHSEDFWYNTLADVVQVCEGMYVKAAVKNSEDYVKGVYNTIFTRIVVNMDSDKVERFQKEKNGWKDYATHSGTIHKGLPTDSEVKPDFIRPDGKTVEQKTCLAGLAGMELYLKKLNENYESAMYCDWHGADFGALYDADSGIEYELELSPKRIFTGTDLKPICYERVPGLIMIKNGHFVNKEDFPAVPKPLLFGLEAAWHKKNNNLKEGEI